MSVTWWCRSRPKSCTRPEPPRRCSPRAQAHADLNAAGITLDRTEDGSEIWVTAGGAEIYLPPERDGSYDEDSVVDAIDLRDLRKA